MNQHSDNLPKLESQIKGTELPEIKISKRSKWWKISLSLENKLLRCISFGLLVCVLIVLVGYNLKSQRTCAELTSVPSPSASEKVCLTEGCVISATNIIERIDQKKDPCDSFYDFACGNFVRKVILPDDKSVITTISTTSDVLSLKLRILVEEELKSTDPPSTKLVKNLYRSCMNERLIDELGTQPLQKILSELDGWPVVEGEAWNEDKFSLTETLYKMKNKGFPPISLFSFRVTTDIRNTSYRIIEFEQAKLGMPSREYFMKGLGDSDVQAYLEFQVSLATKLGADPIKAKKELEENVLFEIELAKHSMRDEERRDLPRLYNKMTIKDLSLLVPDLPWLEITNQYLSNNITVSEAEPIIVTVPQFFIKLSELLNKSPKRVIANYLLWNVVATSASYLSREIRQIELRYMRKILGVGKEAPRWKDCMDIVSHELSFAVGSLYVRNFFKEEAKAEAESMVGYIRRAFDKNLEALDWMDEQTRARAMKKAKAIRPFIGYPSELLNETLLMEHYGELRITDGELLSNMANISLNDYNLINGLLREKVKRTDWKIYGAAAIVNAFYSSVDNAILFPAGILQGIFFEARRPKYMNYGAIGLVIGHEITHGFDDEGSQFNANGDLENWWDFETREKFLNKSRCIISQYSGYHVPEVNLYLNGIITQGENIADNGGIKEAYRAYEQWIKDHGEEKQLPGLPYTPRQLFWISAAHLWCSKERPEYMKMSVMSKNHSPPRHRINGPMRNLKEFSRDWQCAPESGMNPKKKCSVW